MASQCTEGNFCPDGGMVAPRACLPGRFCAGPGASAQAPCLPSFFCPRANMTAPEQCPIAHRCPTELMTDAIECPAGTAVAAGSIACLQCEFGPVCRPLFLLASSNFTCAPGWGPSSLGCVVCSAGYASDGKSPCRLCAAGTYTNRNATVNCLPCSGAGLVCDQASGRAYTRDGFWSYSWPGDRSQALHTVPCIQTSLCRAGSPSSPRTLCDPTRLQSPLNVECAQCQSDRSK